MKNNFLDKTFSAFAYLLSWPFFIGYFTFSLVAAHANLSFMNYDSVFSRGWCAGFAGGVLLMYVLEAVTKWMKRKHESQGCCKD